MQTSNIPTKTPVVWGSSAGGSYIHTVPNSSQIGITNGAASFTDGFPPLCFLSTLSGGIAVDGRDFNGILSSLSGWTQWFQAGAPVSYDSAFCTSVGGYPKGAMLLSTVTAGLIWYNTAENNTTDPDGGSPANWRSWGPSSVFPAGTTMPFYQASAPTGWTQVTSLNDVAMRVVNGTGGGSHTSGTGLSSLSTGGHSITQAELPNCNFTVTDPGHSHPIGVFFSGPSGTSSTWLGPGSSSNSQPATTGITVSSGGSDTAHTHSINVNYADFILAAKN